MKALIISHASDYDGWTSAAVCDSFFNLLGYERSLVGVDYAKDLTPSTEDLLQLVEGFDQVVLCDFTFDHKTMEALKQTGKLTWIDHHKTAIEGSAGRYDDLPGIRRVGEAACELAFEYFKETFTNLGHISRQNQAESGPELLPTPPIVRMVGKHDVFRQDEEWDSLVLPVHCALISAQDDFKIGSPDFTANWEHLLRLSEEGVAELALQGEVVLKYRRAIDLENVSSAHCLTFADFPELKFLSLNGSKGVDQFRGVDTTGFAGMASYRFNGTEWSFGLYGWDNSPDLSTVALHFGGGGHAKACGMRLPSLEGLEFSPLPAETSKGETNPPTEQPFNLNWGDVVQPSRVQETTPENEPDEA